LGSFVGSVRAGFEARVYRAHHHLHVYMHWPLLI